MNWLEQEQLSVLTKAIEKHSNVTCKWGLLLRYDDNGLWYCKLFRNGALRRGVYLNNTSQVIKVKERIEQDAQWVN